MGCCLSKKPAATHLSSGTSCDANKSPDPVKPNVNKPVIELPVKSVTELRENQAVEEAKPAIISEKQVQQAEEEKDVLVISQEISKKKKTESKEKASGSVAVVRTSSCTKEEVDAILIQCGKLSRSNSTRRYSGSKRSFDFDQNERTHGGGGGDVEAGMKTPQRNRHRGAERVNGSPRERRRRTPSRERGGAGSRRVSRSPAKRSEITNPSGSLVISSNRKFVTVPATDKKSNNKGDQPSKRVTVKRSIGEACRTAAMSSVHPPSRKAEQSPYRRNPLGEIDQNATKGDNKIKRMIKRENETAKLTKPQGISRSRSLRKSRDFDLLQPSGEEDKSKSSYTALLLKDIKNFHGKSGDDDDDEDPFSLLPSCVTKACSIVEAVEGLNSSSDLNQFRFTSSVKKADLMEPSFEKYVTLKRGCSLEEQESCGSNNIT